MQKESNIFIKLIKRIKGVGKKQSLLKKPVNFYEQLKFTGFKLIMFTFFSYDKTILSCLLSMLILTE